MDGRDDRPTMGEIYRAVQRMEATASRIERAVNSHEARLSVLEQTKTDVKWGIHLAWMAVVAAIEGLFHWKSQ